MSRRILHVVVLGALCGLAWAGSGTGASASGAVAGSTAGGAAGDAAGGAAGGGARAARAGAPVWTAEALPAGLGPLSGLSCQPARGGAHCVAVGQTGSGTGAIVVSDNGGVSWHAAGLPAGLGSLGNVSCASASHCWADGHMSGGGTAVLASADGGSTWRLDTMPAAQSRFRGLGQISCVGRDCWAGEVYGNAVLASRNGGASWSVQTLTLPCAGLCAAYLATDVTFVNSLDGYATGLSQCGGQHVTQCGGVIWRTTDGGTRWRVLKASLRLPSVDAIACVDARHCWAAAATFTTGEMYGTADGGARWRRQALPRFGGYFNDIHCARRGGADRCFAVGQNERGTAAVVMSTTDGGYRWSRDRVPSQTGALGEVAFVGTAGRAVGEDSSRRRAVALGS